MQITLKEALTLDLIIIIAGARPGIFESFYL